MPPALHPRLAAVRPLGPSRPALPPARTPLDALTVVIFLVGLAPFAGLAWRHAWDPRELGLAAAMVIFSGRELLRTAAGRIRRSRS